MREHISQMGDLLKAITSNYKIYAYIGLAVILLGLFSYVQYLRYENASYATKNIQLTELVSSQKIQIGELNNNIKKIQEIQTDIVKKIEDSNKSEKVLDEKLSKLEKVAVSKPTLVTKLINDGAKQRNRCFELATGAKKIKDEKNTVCPSLLK